MDEGSGFTVPFHWICRAFILALSVFYLKQSALKIYFLLRYKLFLHLVFCVLQSYSKMSVNADDYEGKSVFIIGRGLFL